MHLVDVVVFVKSVFYGAVIDAKAFFLEKFYQSDELFVAVFSVEIENLLRIFSKCRFDFFKRDRFWFGIKLRSSEF